MKAAAITAIQVCTTTASREDAEQIARHLVESKLAACVQISGPVHSTYRWQGEIQSDPEWLCVAKTTRERYSAVEQAMLALHKYDEPEIIALPILAGSAGYLQWLQQQVAQDD